MWNTGKPVEGSPRLLSCCCACCCLQMFKALDTAGCGRVDYVAWISKISVMDTHAIASRCRSRGPFAGGGKGAGEGAHEASSGNEATGSRGPRNCPPSLNSSMPISSSPSSCPAGVCCRGCAERRGAGADAQHDGTGGPPGAGGGAGKRHRTHARTAPTHACGVLAFPHMQAALLECSLGPRLVAAPTYRASATPH